MELRDISRDVIAMLKRDYEPDYVSVWFGPLRFERADESRVRVVAPNQYYVSWLTEKDADNIEQAVGAVLERPARIEFAVADGAAPPIERRAAGATTHRRSPPAPAEAPAAAVAGGGDRADRAGLPIPPSKTFENFVDGPSNEFAHACAVAVAAQPGEPEYNPLFIYGDTGLGKTHLMLAVANRVRSQRRDTRIVYTTAEHFVNEFIEAASRKQMEGFRRRYRIGPEILLIDDVQFFSQTERAQDELFHTFEGLQRAGVQMIFTADVPPREIRGMEPRLRTRFESGVIADIQPPDMETLLAILRVKSEEIGLDVPSEVAEYIALRVRGSIRQLEGALHRLKKACDIYRVPPTVDFVRRQLKDVLTEHRPAPKPEEIIKIVAEFYNVTVSDLKGSRRQRQIVQPRHVAMWLVRKHCGLSFPELGRLFNRDQSTVQHGCRSIQRKLGSDADIRKTVEAIERHLHS